ncbi:MAG: hypothetical protein HOU01_12610 [Streptomycetaceae bacterium]|nr:hypothetical protein [Streptomycetaceae bacterium]
MKIVITGRLSITESLSGPEPPAETSADQGHCLDHHPSVLQGADDSGHPTVASARPGIPGNSGHGYLPPVDP